MKIESKIITPEKVYQVTYIDVQDESEIVDRKIQGVHAYCFYKDQLVIVYAKKKDSWTPPGGGTEDGENIRQTVEREVREETNMKVLKQRIIGFQDIDEGDKIVTQTRSVCIVEPYGDFIEDPDDGEITEIKLIDPKDYKQYFDWKEIGDHIMQRALEIKAELEKELE